MAAMDQRIYIGKGLRRLLFELVREIAGSNIARAERLLRDLYANDVITMQSSGYRAFDVARAKATISSWLTSDECNRFSQDQSTLFSSRAGLLRIWDDSNITLPVLLSKAVQFAPWLNELEAQQSLMQTAQGIRLLPKARLAIWLRHKHTLEEALAHGDVLLLRAGVQGLRNRGQWYLAAQLCAAVLERYPDTIRRHPGFAITAALGFAQAQDFTSTQEYITALKQMDHPLPVAWRSRLMSLEAFSLAENGSPEAGVALARQSARLTRVKTERMLAALAGAWGDIRLSKTKRAARMLRFLDQSLPPDQPAIQSIVSSWYGTAQLEMEVFDHSLELYKQSARLALKVGWKDRVLSAAINHASNSLDLGDYRSASPVLLGMISRFEQEGRIRVLPWLWSLAALTFDVTPGNNVSWWAHNRAISLCAFSGTQGLVPVIFSRLANLALRTGRWRKALEAYEAAEKAALTTNNLWMIGSARFNRSRLEFYMGKMEKAHRLLNSAYPIFKEIDHRSRMGDVHRQRAEFLLDQNQLSLVNEELDLADSLYRSPKQSRELDFIPLLRLELQLRENPSQLSFNDLDPVRSSDKDLGYMASLASVLLAVGFAIKGDGLSSRLYARQALASLTENKDIYQSLRALNLAQSIKNRSPELEFIISYWQHTLELPD